jgi:hypothetical protein
MHGTQFVEVFRTRQRHELELVLSELRAARIRAWKQEHSLAGPVTEASPFPVIASGAFYTVSVPRPEMLRATAVLAQSVEAGVGAEERVVAPAPRFARYTAFIVLTLLLLGLVRDFIATLRAAS